MIMTSNADGSTETQCGSCGSHEAIAYMDVGTSSCIWAITILPIALYNAYSSGIWLNLILVPMWIGGGHPSALHRT